MDNWPDYVPKRKYYTRPYCVQVWQGNKADHPDEIAMQLACSLHDSEECQMKLHNQLAQGGYFQR